MPASFLPMSSRYARGLLGLTLMVAMIGPTEARAHANERILERQYLGAQQQPHKQEANRSKHAASDKKKRAEATSKSKGKRKSDPLTHEEIIRVVATGYTAGVESTGKKPGHPQYGITYSGVKVRRGKLSTIAADPKLFPIGTVLFIPGYGYGIVADTGSRIKGYKIDLYFPSKRQVFQEWGKKAVDVRVIKKGNGKVTESMLDNISDVILPKSVDPTSG